MMQHGHQLWEGAGRGRGDKVNCLFIAGPTLQSTQSPNPACTHRAHMRALAHAAASHPATHTPQDHTTPICARLLKYPPVLPPPRHPPGSKSQAPTGVKVKAQVAPAENDAVRRPQNFTKIAQPRLALHLRASWHAVRTGWGTLGCQWAGGESDRRRNNFWMQLTAALSKHM